MKKMFIISLFTIFSSCYEDEKLKNEEQLDKNEFIQSDFDIELIILNSTNESRVSSPDFPGKFLSFKTQEDFDRVYLLLEQELEQNNKYIQNLVGEIIIEEKYDSVFEQHKLDPYKPLKDFENRYGHYSLREDIIQKESVWLSKQLDEFDDNDPDNHFIGDVVLRSLLNDNSEVMIGGQLKRSYEWGFVNINNLEEDYYRLYNKDDKNLINDGLQITIYASDDRTSCEINKSHTYYFHTDKRRKMKIQAKLERESNHNRNKFLASTKYYKKVAGTWIRKSANVFASIGGYHDFAPNCNQNIEFFKPKSSSSGSVTSTHVNPMPSGAMNDMSFRSKKIYSTHKLWGDHNKVIDLYYGLQ